MVGGAGRAGFSLVEVAVALALFACGLLAVAAGATRATRWLSGADAVDGAGLLATAVMDSLLQTARPTGGSTVRGRYALAWTANSASGRTTLLLVVRYADGSGMRADTFGAHTGRWPAPLSHVP